MRVLISGSSGLIGSRLAEELGRQGSTVVRLVRPGHSARGETIEWDPAGGHLEGSRLEGLDAVVHLAGESIAEGRWTAAKKRRIRDSRVQGTRLLAERISRLSTPPKVVVSGSAVGFYGDRGSETLTESSGAGRGFLSEVCREWEAAADAVAANGVRLVLLRTGVVLARGGGALPKMLLPFRLGVGGRLGDGRQYMSWISVEDIVALILFAVSSSSIQGPLNAVSPNPVTNEEFTKALGKVLHRPAVLPAPRGALRLVLGEMADALLFASQRVLPEKAVSAGFRFRHPDVGQALSAVLSSR